jgi:uncharacterized protein YjbI with pentapeptide repeats
MFKPYSATSLEDREKAEKNKISRNRAYVQGFSVPNGLVEQTAITDGNIDDGNISGSKARSFHLNGSWAKGFDASHTELENCDWAKIFAPGLKLNNSLSNGLILNSAYLAANDKQPAADLSYLKAPYQKISYEIGRLLTDPLQARDANLQGVNGTGMETEKADFTKAYMQGFNWANSTHAGANLTRARLQKGEGFDTAKLTRFVNYGNPKDKHVKTNLKYADVSGLNFKNQKMSDIVTKWAMANGTDFTGMGLYRRKPDNEKKAKFRAMAGAPKPGTFVTLNEVLKSLESDRVSAHKKTRLENILDKRLEQFKNMKYRDKPPILSHNEALNKKWLKALNIKSINKGDKTNG